MVNLTRAALINADPTLRPALLIELNEREGIRVYPVTPDEKLEPLPDDALFNMVAARVRAALGKAACDIARVAEYENAGTIEFLYHPGEKFFAFLEVNTRLQVEHPITEATTDTDLVKLQIHVANGGRLDTKTAGFHTGDAVEGEIDARRAPLRNAGRARDSQSPANNPSNTSGKSATDSSTRSAWAGCRNVDVAPREAERAGSSTP